MEHSSLVIMKIIFNLLCGAVVLMYGVDLMSNNLEKCAGKTLNKVLSRFTDKLWKSLCVGTTVTALVQSSTAVTVITVGLVNTGMMNLRNAVGIIYGANIGTTITAQLMSFHITHYAIYILIIGLGIHLFSIKQTIKQIGSVLTGFGFMLFGIKILNQSTVYIHQSQAVYDFFQQYGQSPWLGMVIGMVTTMLVHSSSATVGLTIALFNANLIGFESAIALTLGDNIGTCITAQLASIYGSLEAKRTAWAHTLYNVIGVFIGMLYLLPFSKFVVWLTYSFGQDHTRLIANTHTLFNIMSALLFIPFTPYYVQLIQWLISEKKSGKFVW